MMDNQGNQETFGYDRKLLKPDDAMHCWIFQGLLIFTGWKAIVSW
jgi:hypothetical protein